MQRNDLSWNQSLQQGEELQPSARTAPTNESAGALAQTRRSQDSQVSQRNYHIWQVQIYRAAFCMQQCNYFGNLLIPTLPLVKGSKPKETVRLTSNSEEAINASSLFQLKGEVV